MRPRATAAIVAVLVLLVGPVLLAWRGLVGPVLAGVVVVAVLAVVVVWASLGRESGPASAEAGTVWDLIPSRQYGGRHAESGGIARGEQEQALQEVADRAEEMDDRRGER